MPLPFRRGIWPEIAWICLFLRRRSCRQLWRWRRNTWRRSKPWRRGNYPDKCTKSENRKKKSVKNVTGKLIFKAIWWLSYKLVNCAHSFSRHLDVNWSRFGFELAEKPWWTGEEIAWWSSGFDSKREKNEKKRKTWPRGKFKSPAERFIQQRLKT